MFKPKIRKLFIIIFSILINMFISFSITTLLHISNTIVFKTYCALYNNITWETILCICLSIIEAYIYEYSFKNIKS